MGPGLNDTGAIPCLTEGGTFAECIDYPPAILEMMDVLPRLVNYSRKSFRC